MTHTSVLISALAHIGLVLLAAFGLPTLLSPPEPVEVPIPVKVTVVSERTEARGPLPPVEEAVPETPPEPPEPEPVAEEPPPVEPPPPEKPLEVAALAPDPPPETPPAPKPEAAPAVAPPPASPPEPKKDPPPVSKDEPPPLPQRPPQQQARARPPPAKPPEPDPAPVPPPPPRAAPKTPPDELAALRRAARPDELDTLRSAVSEDTPPPREEAEEPVFTISEVHRLFRQLSGCWQTIPGLAPSERHIVVLEIALGADRRVTSVKAVDAENSHSYRAARERAERALRHPDCEQLDVPPGKMALWQSLTLRFDPRRMQ